MLMFSFVQNFKFVDLLPVVSDGVRILPHPAPREEAKEIYPGTSSLSRFRIFDIAFFDGKN